MLRVWTGGGWSKVIGSIGMRGFLICAFQYSAFRLPTLEAILPQDAYLLVSLNLEVFAHFAAFPFANFAVKGCCSSRGKQQTLTAKGAKKGREVREKIQTEATGYL